MDKDYKNYLLDCETLLQRITIDVENENLTDLENYEHIKQHVKEFVDIREKFLNREAKKDVSP